MQLATDWSNVEPIISRYEELPAACHDYDPRALQVAALIAKAVNQYLPEVIVEHIGSTSVPGCAGKGVIDLMVIYPAGKLEAAKSLLDALGFQRQTTRDLFPETRPMRIGAIEHDGKTFRVHAHVIAVDSPEVEGLRSFRDRLRADPNLVAGYVARKREIIASGVADSVDYSIEKGAFVQMAVAKSRLLL
ncbi:MAG: GrpB family protein [Blastocatellia bacterium]